MYVGRIVAVGRSAGKSWVGYRVSSRSFPNRKAEIQSKSIFVSPLDERDLVRNPYIGYRCIRIWEDVAVVANGIHSDMILEKIQDGILPLDAIALSLVAYGYERDELHTPRLAGAVMDNKAWLGITSKQEFRVKEYDLRDGNAFMAATYEKTEFEPTQLSAKNVTEIAKGFFELDFEKPVCAAAAMARQGDKGFELAVYNPA